ncbi:MAG: HEAT repeat domain-containing protein [Candidatus Thiodiazotropha sp.]
MSDTNNLTGLAKLLGLALDPNISEEQMDEILEEMEAEELERGLPPADERAETLEETLELFRQSDRSFSSEEIEYYMKRHYSSVELAKLVARHPSCPANVLRIMHYFLPEDAAMNPSLAEYRKERNWEQVLKNSIPGSAEGYGWSSESLHENSLSPRVPYRFKVDYWLANGSNADKRFIVSCDNIDEDILNQYVNDKSSTIRKSIAERKKLSEHLLDTLLLDKAKTVRQALAKNPKIPSNILAKLAKDKEPRVRAAALANENCPEDVKHIARLEDAAKPGIEDKAVMQLSTEEILNLLGDEGASIEMLTQLAQHSEAWIRAGVALHQNTPVEVLRSLQSDSASVVRESLAFNPNTPTELLVAWIKEKPLWRALANNPALPQEQQLFLVEHGSEQLRQELANTTDDDFVWKSLSETDAPKKNKSKKKTWRDALKIIQQPSGKGLYQLQRGVDTRQLFVAKMIARHPKCPDSLKKHYAYYIFDSLAKNPTVALQLLENPQAMKGVPYADWKVDQWLSDGFAPGHVSNFYLQSRDIPRRRKAVDNPTACIARLQPQVYIDDIHMKKRLAPLKGNTAFMFEVLARDKKASVRELVAKNCKCPADLLQLLAEDKNNTVKMAALQNRSFTGTVKQKQVSGTDTPQLRNKGQKRERIKLAKEAKRVTILADLAQDRGYEVRLAVAENERATAKVMMELIKDPHEKVRAAVAKHQKTPDDERYTLLQDADDNVRRHALQVLTWHRSKLKNDDDRQSVETIFEEMSSDPCEGIQDFIAGMTTKQDTQEKLLAIGTEKIKRVLASNRSLHTEVIEKLKVDESKWVREVLLRSTPYEEVYFELLNNYSDIADKASSNHDLVYRANVQAALIVHPNPKVREGITYLINDSAMIMKLAEDEDLNVRESISRNEKLNKKHVDALLAKRITRKIVENLVFENRSALKPHLPALMKHKSEEIRCCLAESLPLNSKLEEVFLNDNAPSVRQSLIKNDTGRLSKLAQEKLKDDPEKSVRRIFANYYR